MSSLRVDHAVSSGTFSLDCETFEVENNIWLVGNDDEVLVIDAAHDHEPIVAAVGDRKALAIVFSGNSLGLAIGAPVGTALGNVVGWRAA